MFIDREKPPEIFGAANFMMAGAVYAAAIFAIWIAGRFNSAPKEEVFPIDMTIVVHENLEGAEDEPPPETPPQPEPEPEPEPPAPPEPPPPAPAKQPEETVKDALVREAPKTNKVEVAKNEAKPPKAKPEEPKPDPKKLREERIARMRASTKKIKDSPAPARQPRNNGRTEASPPDLARLLGDVAFKPGSRNSGLDASDAKRCISLIYEAYYSQWTSPVKTRDLGEMLLKVSFSRTGEVVSWKLVKSSGDAAADASVAEAAGKVKSVRGLSAGFIEKNPSVVVRFTVK